MLFRGDIYFAFVATDAKQLCFANKASAFSSFESSTFSEFTYCICLFLLKMLAEVVKLLLLTSL